MPQNWTENELNRLTKQGDASRNGTGLSGIRLGRMLREGTKEATEFATFWDIVLLDQQYRNTDLNFSQAYAPGTEKPVYPVVANVAVPVSVSGEPDAIVTLHVAPSGSVLSRLTLAYEVLDAEDYDISIVHGGDGCYLIGTSAGCDGQNYFEWGILY